MRCAIACWMVGWISSLDELAGWVDRQEYSFPFLWPTGVAPQLLRLLWIEGMAVPCRPWCPWLPADGTTGVRGTIPPNAHLTFDVELVDVK